jgi:carbon monoxide dehydrogenase subunit G
MKFEGSVEIKAPRARVWEFLTDPQQVATCGPGVQSIEQVDATHFKVHAKVGVGFISARFVVNAEFIELAAPDHAVIQARGSAPGSAVDATARMSLRDADRAAGGAETAMDWTADVTISGTLASVGARMIEGTASKIIDQTFACVRSRLEA